MSDASSIRTATTLGSAAGRNKSSIRFSGNETWVSTGTQWAPIGREILTYLTAELPSGASSAVFNADRAYQLVGVQESHAVVSTAANTLMLKKAAAGVAAASGTDMLSAGIDLKAAVDTVQSGTLSATAANTRLAAGDRLVLTTSAATTGLAGAVVTVILRAV